jgi:hypothetical protein
MLQHARSVVFIPGPVLHGRGPGRARRSKALADHLLRAYLPGERSAIHFVELDAVSEPELRQLRCLRFAGRGQRRALPLEGVSLSMPHECQGAHSQ